MACCGQKRDAVATEMRTAQIIPPVREVRAEIRPAQSTEKTVTLRYRARSGVVVHGPVTGTRYQFASSGSMQAVDRRDADGLTGTGMFERIQG